MSELISDRLYRVLTEQIISGEFRPGQRIDAGAIAAEFGISWAPVRDALACMENEHLVITFESDKKLHGTIIAATGNARMQRARSTVEPWVAWLRVMGATGPHRIAGSTARHLPSLSWDGEAAGAEAATHLDEVEAWAIEDFENSAAGRALEDSQSG